MTCLLLIQTLAMSLLIGLGMAELIKLGVRVVGRFRWAT